MKKYNVAIVGATGLNEAKGAISRKVGLDKVLVYANLRFMFSIRV